MPNERGQHGIRKHRKSKQRTTENQSPQSNASARRPGELVDFRCHRKMRFKLAGTLWMCSGNKMLAFIAFSLLVRSVDAVRRTMFQLSVDKLNDCCALCTHFTYARRTRCCWSIILSSSTWSSSCSRTLAVVAHFNFLIKWKKAGKINAKDQIKDNLFHCPALLNTFRALNMIRCWSLLGLTKIARTHTHTHTGIVPSAWLRAKFENRFFVLFFSFFGK